MGCLRGFVFRAAVNDIKDAQKKSEVRGRWQELVAMQEEWRAPEDYCTMILQIEGEALRRGRGEAVIAKLIACAQTMKPAQRAVAVIMIDTLVTTARFPTNQSILEQLSEKEPDLQLGTVKERRKEVRKKFRPILGEDFDENL
jgi:thioredoxin-like negative regulator of GroEL